MKRKTLYEMPQSEVVQLQPDDCIMDVLNTSTGGTQDYSDTDWSDLVN